MTPTGCASVSRRTEPIPRFERVHGPYLLVWRFQLVVAMGEDVGSWHGGAVWVGNLVGLMVGCVVR